MSDTDEFAGMRLKRLIIFCQPMNHPCMKVGTSLSAIHEDAQQRYRNNRFRECLVNIGDAEQCRLLWGKAENICLI